ncbi:MAG: hypothetical protein ACOYJ6_11305 [Caulobacterales bacterium]
MTGPPKPWRLWIVLPFLTTGAGALAGLGLGLATAQHGHALMTPVLFGALAGMAAALFVRRPD